MCHNLKFDLLMAQVNILVLIYIVPTIVNGKNAIFSWTQIQRSDGGPAIRYAILIAKSIFLLLMNTAAAAAAHSGRKRQK